MSWFIHELVRNGNSSAIVQSYDKNTKFIVLNNIQGEFPDGCTIVGEESGTVGILNGFTISEIYSGEEYADTSWDDLNNMVFESGDGPRELVAIDEHFTGLLSQDYQTTFIVREN
jgi:hypothetical protein